MGVTLVLDGEKEVDDRQNVFRRNVFLEIKLDETEEGSADRSDAGVIKPFFSLALTQRK
jgi:hypothetical protein